MDKTTTFDLRQTGSFNVTDHFLTTFYLVEKLNGILRKNRGKGFSKILRMGQGGQKLPNYAYVINEWPLMCLPAVGCTWPNSLILKRNLMLTKSHWGVLVNAVEPSSSTNDTFGKGFLGVYLGPKRMRMGSGKGPTIRNFIVCIVQGD